MWFLSELNGLWGILESKNFRFMLPIILIKLNLDQINNRVCKSVVINKKIRNRAVVSLIVQHYLNS